MTTDIQAALWANEVQRLCLQECGGDVESALSAADHMVSTMPVGSGTEATNAPDLSVFLAHDIYNRRAQGVLNASLESARDMRSSAVASLLKAAKRSRVDGGRSVERTIVKYQRDLSDLLTQTQVASALEGAQQVASRVPALERDAAQLGPSPTPRFPVTTGPHTERVRSAAQRLAQHNVLSRTGYDVIDDAAKTKSAAVTAAGAQEALEKVRTTLSQGRTEDGQEALEQAVLRAVEQGTFLSDGHLEVLLRASVQTAFSDGQFNILQNPLVRERLPYASYSANHDDRVRHNHLALEKLGLDGSNVYRNDDPVFQLFRPPWDYSDRCSWTPISVRVAAEAGVAEAQRWRDTGVPPSEPDFVDMPPFSPPEGFERALGSAPMSVRLSLEPLMAFAIKPAIDRLRPSASGPMRTDSVLKGMYGSAKTKAGKKVQKTALDSVTADLYPRDKSNRFLDKRTIAKYASDPDLLPHFRDSIPEQHRPKLDRLVAQLHSGGTVHHPSENNKLGVDLHGNIPDPDWAHYDWRLQHSKEWKERDEQRAKRRSAVDAATKTVRDPDQSRRLQRSISSAHEQYASLSVSELRARISSALATYGTYLSDAVDALEGIASDDSSVRALSRALHSAQADTDRHVEAYISEVKSIASGREPDYRDLSRCLEDNFTTLLKLFEDILEEEHKRLDEEAETDSEPDIPEEPSEHSTIGLSLEDLHASIALATVTWQPYQGPRGGRGWKSSTGRIVYGGDKPSGRGTPEEENSGRTRKAGGVPAIGGGGRADERQATPVSREMAGEAARPARESTNTGGQGKDTPNNPVPDRAAPRRQPSTPAPAPVVRRPASQRQAILDNVDKEFKRYSSYFRKKRQPEVAEWVDELRQHVQQVGPDRALMNLGHYDAPTSSAAPQEKVQYVGTGYFVDDPNLKFLEDYLDEVGITFIPDYRTMRGLDKSKPLVASAPVVKSRRGGDTIARGTNLLTKLEESKLLPGLESSEDIHQVVGERVSQFTPHVISKLDEVYGRGKWIVKSYGDEAYGGFGIFFPQRVRQIQRESKQAVYEAGQALRKKGYIIQRDQSGEVSGVSDGSTTYSIYGGEYESIGDEKVKRLIRQVAANYRQERGAVLPNNSEESVRQDYGVSFIKDSKGEVTSIVDSDGVVTSVGTPAYERLYTHKWDGLQGYNIDKAISAVNEGYTSDVDSRFMVQPAFKAVGVSEFDRALGFTWETSYEGRVHVSTRDGKASVVPYATMANRGDAFPVVFANKDTVAMERAVQEAIDALPESERSGQVYAPDVMKTTEGWRVVELNAASEFGQSMWLEENPFVIDAYVSHLAGRTPAHAEFIQSLLQGEAAKSGLASRVGMMDQGEAADTDSTDSAGSAEGGSAALHGKGIHGKGAALATDDQGHDHAAAGTGRGGQFVKKGSGGSSVGRSGPKQSPNQAPRPPLERRHVRAARGTGPGGPIKTVASAVVGAIRGALIAGRAAATGKPEMVSREEHQAAVDRARRKYENVILPTAEEVAQNQAGLAEFGAQHYRRNLVGNSGDRRRRREKLMREFGDGQRCPCVYCGVLLSGDGDLEQDKMYTAAEGGRYRMSNLVPACNPCNKRRGDMPFEEAIEEVTRYAGDA